MKTPFAPREKSLGLSESVDSDGGFLVAPACPKCGVHLNGDKCPKCKNRWTLASQKNLTKRELDAAAKDVHPNPTLAQKEAGNYAKGHVSWQGIPITIESAKGTKRRGQSRAGKKWSVTMRNHYGYIKRTKSDADGDQIDVFLADDGKPGADLNSDIVFVVNQHKLNGDFDEHKCMLGFTNAEAAKAAYLSNYSPGWKGFGSIAPMTLDRFKEWINGKTGKPVAKALISIDEVTKPQYPPSLWERRKELPSLFMRTHYALPTPDQIDEFEKFPELTAQDIRDGVGYTIVGRGMRGVSQQRQIVQSIQMLVDRYPDRPAYPLALAMAEAEKPWYPAPKLFDDIGASERLDAMADILGGCFGWKGVSLFGKDRGEKHLHHICKGWNKLDHPRGPNGRFIPKNSPEALASAKTAIERALHGRQNTESHRALVEHLVILSTGQLHALKKEYGLSASAEDKPKLVAKIADRLNKGRRKEERDGAAAVRLPETAAVPLASPEWKAPPEWEDESLRLLDGESMHLGAYPGDFAGRVYPDKVASPELMQAARDAVAKVAAKYPGELIPLNRIRDEMPGSYLEQNAAFFALRKEGAGRLVAQSSGSDGMIEKFGDAEAHRVMMATIPGNSETLAYFEPTAKPAHEMASPQPGVVEKESGGSDSDLEVTQGKAPELKASASYLANSPPPSPAPKKNPQLFEAEKGVLSAPAKAFDQTYARYLQATGSSDTGMNRFAHERLVKEAQAYGQPIADAVLDEYPHLRAKPQVALDAGLRTAPKSREVHVSGATFRHKDAIRHAGGSWDKAKGVWIVTPTGAGKLAKLPGLHFGGPGKAKRLGRMKSPLRRKRLAIGI